MQLEDHRQLKELGPFGEGPLTCADHENGSTGNPWESSSAGPILNQIAMDGLPADLAVRQLLMQFQGQPELHAQTSLHDSVIAPRCYTPSTMPVSSQMAGQMSWVYGDVIVRDLCSHLDSFACPAPSHSAAFPPDFLCDATNTAYDPFTFAPAMDLAFYHHGLHPSADKQQHGDMTQAMPAREASTMTVKKMCFILGRRISKRSSTRHCCVL
jgi:hypothetical protein